MAQHTAERRAFAGLDAPAAHLHAEPGLDAAEVAHAAARPDGSDDAAGE